MRYQPHYPDPRHGRGSAGVIIATVLALGVCVMIALVVLGLFFVGVSRTAVHTAHEAALQARVAEQAAEAQLRASVERLDHEILEQHPVPPVVEAKEPAQPPARDPDMIPVAQREITLQLDQEGQVTMDGQIVPIDELETALANARKGRESTLSVVVRADAQCRFQYVAAVLEICKKVDLPNVQVATRAD
jgi:biopolymer transport protein ExbD